MAMASESALHARVNGPLSSLSTLSLPQPEGTHDEPKRRLLLIYIHGFMGSEASFHDLPAHVHDLLTDLLSESHIVYTRLYPRYKSHGELRSAVDQFSAWLAPHEADDLDVILLGHSLGGILAADVALMQENEQPKHRILGLVNFDAPFLGLHPRVIPTGIMGSIPRKDFPEDKVAGEQESPGLEPYKPAAPSPNFDPPFKNDVRLVDRGFLKGMMHFVNKNTDNLSRSIFDRLVSPVKFANCVNNFSELRRRHRRLMALENAELSPDRVRFVNYYTTSTGRYPRKVKAKPAKTDEELDQIDQVTVSSSQERSTAPSIFSEAETTTTATTVTCESANDEQALTATSEVSLVTDEPESERELDLDSEKTISSPDITSTESTPSLVQKESPSQSDKIPDTLSPSPSEETSTPNRKLRKFILLPSNHWKYNDNSHWTPILMEDMDEVMAHQTMFIPRGANYEFLVGDTVALIEQWVQSDLNRRLLQEGLD